jgi:hypothetical protein
MPLQDRREGVDPNKHVLFGCRQAAIRLDPVPMKKRVKLASGSIEMAFKISVMLSSIKAPACAKHITGADGGAAPIKGRKIET